MADDKPRHKPQPKRTLEEVLRSLKDLVRNDLTGAPAAPPARETARRPPAADEPDSFNEALNRLDEIIDEKIVRPTAHKRTEPPGPPPELEIAWDDVDQSADDGRDASAASDGDDATALSLVPPDAESSVPPLELAPASEQEQPSAAASDDAAEEPELRLLETIELGAIAFEDPDPPPQTGKPAGAQETFGFDAQEAEPLDESAWFRHSRAAAVDDGSGAPDTKPREHDAPAAAPPAMENEHDSETAAAADQPAIDGGDDGFELRLEELSLTPEDEPEAPRARGGGADAGSKPPAARPAGAAAGNGNAGRDKRPGREPPTLNQEIPVLQDVAPLEPVAAALPPDAARVREIAIRAVARLNIERRKLGEPPLDIKTIERLCQYLTDAFTRPDAK